MSRHIMRSPDDLTRENEKGVGIARKPAERTL
jgi:hypothetical protein